MKVLKSRKGFTLIELLAVIVVLAIVMVLATTTVLPYMSNSKKDAFVIEANTAREAAAQAVSLITIGSVTDNYKKTTDGYCFTIENLKALGLFTKGDSSYGGIVTVKQSGNKYIYQVEMQNGTFYVKQSSTNNTEVVRGDINDRTNTNSNAVIISCS